MFSQNNEEKKLDWMYKGAISTVDREEYLLGRSVDKTLEQLNFEEKQKQAGAVPPIKNHVEHECIPPSIRDYKKQQEAEQVDLSAKLQEDPLVAIKKREEETRRQFLQNPIQLKKLQKALKAQEALKRSKKLKKSKDLDLDRKLMEKLKMLKKNPLAAGVSSKKKKIMKESDLDTILMHKFNYLKDKLSDADMRDILAGKCSNSDDSSESSSSEEENTSKKHKKLSNKSKKKKEKDSSSEEDKKYKKTSKKQRKLERSRSKDKKRSSSSESSEEDSKKHKRNYSSSDAEDHVKPNWGLVKPDGSKISLHKSSHKIEKSKPTEVKQNLMEQRRYKPKRLTEEEKEQKRKEMMENAAWRDKEREKNVKRYRENDSKEDKSGDFDPDFLHKQLLKSANNSSVESRIKSNINNIQRSKNAMSTHFSRH